MYRKIIIITIFLMSAIWSSAQLSNNQYKQVTGMIKTQTDILNKRIDSLKLRVKVLEDTAYKYRLVLSFDTTTDFRATKNATGYLLQIKK